MQGRCKVSEWSNWSLCSRACGLAGIQERRRQKLNPSALQCVLYQQKPCNRFCYNNGIPRDQGCACAKPFIGKCCETKFNGGGGPLPLTTIKTTGTTDPCKDYTAIDDYQRSTGFILPTNSKTKPNDRRLKSGWYRFTSPAGGMMPTTAPPERGCGSLAPVWLKGNHPDDVGDDVTLKSCVKVGKNDCAKYASDIKIEKCSQNNKEYYVYQLKPTPSEDMSYCAGKESKCEEGETSKTGYTPDCSSKFPKESKYPIVTVDVKDNRLRFKCKSYPRETNNNNIVHSVTWYQGTPEKMIKIAPQILTNGETEAYLQNKNSFGEEPYFCLGQQIFCKVKSYYKDSEDRSPNRHSNQFFAGFKIEPTTLVLSEKDKPKKLKVTSTVPIICQDGSETCNVNIELGQTNTDNFIDFCTLRFKPGPRGQTKEIEVVAKRDFVDDGDQNMFLKVFIPSHINPVDWDCHKNLTSVKIITKDVKTSRCTSTGDPHIRTFDGLFYNHFSVGDYVLVNSKARKFEIHVRTWRCHTVSCNCGIAVREGDDVVVVDMCRDNIPRARFASTVEPQKGTTITRNNNGKSFVLNFPSGAFVRFDSQRWFGRWYFANFQIQLPSDDYQSTEGLCGTFDGNRNNDMKRRDGQVVNNGRRRTAPTSFTEDWKMGVGESLFYYKGGPKKCLATRAKSYCTCQETCCGKRSVHCDFEGYSKRPKYSQGFKGWKELTFPGAEHCGRRKRRSLDNDIIVLPDDGDSAKYTYNPTPFTPVEQTFPTPKGKTESQSQSHCDSTIRQSSIGKTCLKLIAAFDITDYIEQCVTDVRILDSFTVASDSAINTMASDCEEKTLREIKTFWKKDATGEITPPAEIGDSACPNECSGNGKCANATCICDKNFITDDCSMMKGQAPVLIGIPNNGGICDIRNRDCIRTRVTGVDFIDSSALTCKVQEVKISGKAPKKTGNARSDRGELLSFGEISCLLPHVPVIIDGNPLKSRGSPMGGFKLRVSNDGTNFSKNETMFLVYDSKCISCDKSGSCKWKQSSCKVNEYCFAPDDANPNDWCEICDPTINREGFVERKVNLPPAFTKSTIQHIFKGQEWKFTLPAKDPEAQRLKYSFIGNNHGMRISSDGILSWTPHELGSFTFEVKVEDPCGLTAQQQFKVQVASCMCEGENGGICKWDSTPGDVNKTTCVCPDGCQGEKCLDPVEGRVCRIQTGKQTDDNESDSGLVVALIVIFLIILLVLIFAILVVVHLKKHKQPLTKDNFKEATVTIGKQTKAKIANGAANIYNTARSKKDKNIKMQSVGEVDSAGIANTGYVEQEVNKIDRLSAYVEK